MAIIITNRFILQFKVSIKHYENKNFWRKKSNTQRLSKRSFRLGTLYFTHVKRNTFITLFEGEIEKKVRYKISVV